MTESKSSRRRKFFRAILLVVLVAGFIGALFALRNSGLLMRAVDWIRELGTWAPAAFVVVYIGAVLLSVPASVFTVGAGFVFGVVWGSVYVLIAATVAANLAFLLGRHLARDWIARRMENVPKFRAIDDAVAREGWKIVALIRLVPVFPFSVMSYAFGLTRVSLREYFFGNFTMIPATLMYVYFGTLLGDLTEKVSRPAWIKWVIAAVTAAVVVYLTRFAQRALSRKVR